MQTTALTTDTITYGGYTVTATLYGRHYSEAPGEWRINLATEGVGRGTLRAESLEALHEEFSDFLTEAMADEMLAAMEAYPVDVNEDYEWWDGE